MNKITIAFDCDGTLIQDGAFAEHEIVANERVRSMLIALGHCKNVRIVVWSGGGELWARQVGAALELDRYVWKYTTKNLLPERDKDGHPQFAPDLKPDIAIDDIQDCNLGMINLIVREK